MDSKNTPDCSKKEKFKADFLRRVKENKRTRWIRFGIVSLIYLLWVIWLGNYWFLLGWFLLFDIYITGYIPFTWWKKSKNGAVRGVMSWVDAIVYALILVYFIFAFLGQNYIIPSSSLEKTLLTGDYLMVNKVTYGPRVPMTPVHFPLVHNKMPLVGGDSYASWPQNGYRRLKGLRNVEIGDIVVFNFPAGDTVLTKVEEGRDPRFSTVYYDNVKEYGRQYIAEHPEIFGKIKYRPVDRRTNYVKRAVGLPGQNFRINHDTIYINGAPLPVPKNAQFKHIVFLTRPITQAEQKRYGMSNEALEWSAVSQPMIDMLATMADVPTSYAQALNLPLTQGMLDKMAADGMLVKAYKLNDYFTYPEGTIYDDWLRRTWSPSSWGGPEGVTIPAKGMTIDITPRNWALYERCIRNYEGHSDYCLGQDGVVRDKDGNEIETYTFAMDYYFMMGDNRDCSLDSRFWGFVPEDHIVGTPVIVLASFDRDHGGVRYDRIMRIPNPDKDDFRGFEAPENNASQSDVIENAIEDIAAEQTDSTLVGQ